MLVFPATEVKVLLGPLNMKVIRAPQSSADAMICRLDSLLRYASARRTDNTRVRSSGFTPDSLIRFPELEDTDPLNVPGSQYGCFPMAFPGGIWFVCRVRITFKWMGKVGNNCRCGFQKLWRFPDSSLAEELLDQF